MDDLRISSKIASSGLRAQSKRIRIASENLANAQSLSPVPGGEPYRRQIISFQTAIDRSSGARVVVTAKPDYDYSAFNKKFDPQHPSADPEGYVLMPNVNPLIEMADLREAQQSYEANLHVIALSKAMMKRTVEMLR